MVLGILLVVGVVLVIVRIAKGSGKDSS